MNTLLKRLRDYNRCLAYNDYIAASVPQVAINFLHEAADALEALEAEVKRLRKIEE